MISRVGFVRGCAATAAAAGALGSRALPQVHESALDRYIAKPTPEYTYEVLKTIEGRGYRTHILSMVSQQWRTNREVDQPLWKHWMTVTEPEHIRTPVAVLVVSGGSNNDSPPHHISRVMNIIATRTGAVVAEIEIVPNQPLRFFDQSTPRGEDDLVAYTWDKYLRTGDETWPLRLPMTKAVVRAMDTITSLIANRTGSTVNKFVVGGTSKRGWTSWLTGAADQRVVGIVPVVIDVLNVEPSAEHAYRVYGFWPPALQSYEQMGIMKWFGTPQLESLLTIEDPYSYRNRLVVPKLIVNATGDQFFTPDSSQFYFNSLLGDKYLRYVPNTDHSLKGAELSSARTALAFLSSIIHGDTRPRYDWQMLSDGSIRVHADRQPLTAKLWHAVNPSARDFRLETIGKAFTSTDLHDQGSHTYVGKIATPAHGYAAYFVELAFATSSDLFTVTTGVRVTPDVLPFSPPPHTG